MSDAYGFDMYLSEDEQSGSLDGVGGYYYPSHRKARSAPRRSMLKYLSRRPAPPPQRSGLLYQGAEDKEIYKICKQLYAFQEKHKLTTEQAIDFARTHTNWHYNLSVAYLRYIEDYA
jgi:hypothetical protein